MKLARTLMLATPMMLISAVSQAQVAYNYLNLYCLWDPSIQEYSITVHRFPGQTLVHTIVDQGITTSACTSDPLDLMNWIQQDLQNNGTWLISLQGNGSWGHSNDQIETEYDVFCPDVNGVENPASIGTMMGVSYPPTYSGGNVQTGVVVNYSCPSTPQPPSGSGGSTPITATYAVNPCANGKVAGTVLPGDSRSVQMINTGSNGSGDDDWQTNFMDQSGPTQFNTLTSGTPHCDPSLQVQAGIYLDNNIANVGPVMMARCGSPNTVEAYINSCAERGDDSAYGYQIMCCPPPDVTHGTATGTNCHAMCLPVSVSNVTHGYGPTSPTYNDPATACHDLIADTTSWMDQNSPGGPTQPWICGPNWGVAMGGQYVPNTLNMTCNILSNSEACLGGDRVEVCLTYKCEK